MSTACKAGCVLSWGHREGMQQIQAVAAFGVGWVHCCNLRLTQCNRGDQPAGSTHARFLATWLCTFGPPDLHTQSVGAELPQRTGSGLERPCCILSWLMSAAGLLGRPSRLTLWQIALLGHDVRSSGSWNKNILPYAAAGSTRSMTRCSRYLAWKTR